MPLKQCSINGKPGWKWGDAGKCYPYDPDSEASQKAARKKASKQGQAQAFTKMRAKGLKKPQFEQAEFKIVDAD